jgi:hypothetical protein
MPCIQPHGVRLATLWMRGRLGLNFNTLACDKHDVSRVPVHLVDARNPAIVRPRMYWRVDCRGTWDSRLEEALGGFFVATLMCRGAK